MQKLLVCNIYKEYFWNNLSLNENSLQFFFTTKKHFQGKLLQTS